MSIIGSGISLYFQFAQSTSICFFLMTVFSIPTFLFAYYGSQIVPGTKDAFGFYRFTIGNIGDGPRFDAACNTTSHSTLLGSRSYNGTCVHIFNTAITMPEIVGILSISEILQILSFFCLIFHLQRLTDNIQKEREKSSCSVTDYSIMIRNIPDMCTKQDIAVFFNGLYPLDTADWRGRPPVGTANSLRLSLIVYCEGE